MAVGTLYCDDILKQAASLFRDSYSQTSEYNRNHNDVFKKPEMLAEIGFYFAREMTKDSPNPVTNANPYLMLHATTVVIEDIGRDLNRNGQRTAFWVGIPKLRDTMEYYCDGLHEISPINLEEKEATVIQYQKVRRALSTLYDQLKDAVENNLYRSDFMIENKTLNVLMNYIGPYSDENFMKIPAAGKAATVLPIAERSTSILERRKRIQERHAEHPEWFTSDNKPIIR